MSDSEDHTARPPASIYRVRVAGRLPAGWEDRLGCFRVVHEEKSGQMTTGTLVGAVVEPLQTNGSHHLEEFPCSQGADLRTSAHES